jgi:molybdopterin-guanine dinucleotide biosynthesis protein A
MLTGVILAGGQNRRMDGRSKAQLSLNGESLIERQIRIMQTICSEIIIVSRDKKDFTPFLDQGIKLQEDEIPGKGPLSGMHSAFAKSANKDIWVTACDMPYISAKAAEFMTRMKLDLQCSAVIPLVDNRIHPLHGIYDKHCMPVIETLLKAGNYKVMAMLETVHSEILDAAVFVEQQIDLRFVTNINTLEEYEQILTKHLKEN